MKRLQIQHLRQAVVATARVATEAGTSTRTVERVSQESAIDQPGRRTL